MKKNLKFYKSLLDNELLTCSYDTNYQVLELSSFIVSIKQLLRTLKNLTFKIKKRSDLVLIYVFLENELLKSIFSRLLYKNNKKVDFRVDTFAPKPHKRNIKKLLLGFETTFIKSFLDIEKTFLSNFLLMFGINPNRENNSFGKYKIYSDVKRFKTLSFFVSLINLIVKYA